MINDCMFQEVVYADDLNAYRIFNSTAETATIEKSMELCQTELHAWGRANQVVFDPSKESHHILSMNDPVGENFRLLGVVFDKCLTMVDAVGKLVTDAGCKLRP